MPGPGRRALGPASCPRAGTAAAIGSRPSSTGVFNMCVYHGRQDICRRSAGALSMGLLKGLWDRLGMLWSQDRPASEQRRSATWEGLAGGLALVRNLVKAGTSPRALCLPPQMEPARFQGGNEQGGGDPLLEDLPCPSCVGGWALPQGPQETHWVGTSGRGANKGGH